MRRARGHQHVRALHRVGRPLRTLRSLRRRTGVLRLPRLLDGRRELLVSADRLVRPRPGFSVVRTGIHLEHTHQLTTRSRPAPRRPPRRRVPPALDGPEQRPVGRARCLRPTFCASGASTSGGCSRPAGSRRAPGLGLTNAPDGSSSRRPSRSCSLPHRGAVLNLGMRFQLGLQSDASADRFHLGGLDTIRGFRTTTCARSLRAPQPRGARSRVRLHLVRGDAPVFLDAATIAPERGMPSGALSTASARVPDSALLPLGHARRPRVPVTNGGAPQLRLACAVLRP